MAAGGHFPSDIIWAGLVSLGTAHAIYYDILRIPHSTADLPIETRTTYQPSTYIQRGRYAFIIMGVISAAAVILVCWRYHGLRSSIPLASTPEKIALEVVADRLDVEIELIPSGESVETEGDIHGLGWPLNSISVAWKRPDTRSHVLRCDVSDKGWYGYLDSTMRITAPLSRLNSVSISTHRGNIIVIDSTGRKTDVAYRFPMQLRSDSGRVIKTIPESGSQ